MAVLASTMVGAATYRLTDLGTFAQGAFSQPYEVNAWGQVVGFASLFGSSQPYHGFSYQGGVLKDLGVLPGGARVEGNNSTATCINEVGQVAGFSDTSQMEHAFLRTGGSMIDLGTLGGSSSGADGMNAAGQVVGYARIPSELQHAFLYSGGVMSDLGTLPGGGRSWALDINDSGQIVGFAAIAPEYGAPEHAFVYDHGQMVDIGTLPGGTSSWGNSINNQGKIVGGCSLPGGTTRAFLYSKGMMTDLGSLGGPSSQAYDINGQGDIVGSSTNALQAPLAFLYSNGVMTDLNTQLDATGAGWQLGEARGINDSGQIVASAMKNGQAHAVLLTPTTGLFRLGIRSLNPATGVPMTVWTTDINGRRSASTSFDRLYNSGTNASVTSPLSVGNQWFERWEKDGLIIPGPHRTITVMMDGPHTIKAVYRTRRTLTVASQNPNSGVPISVWTVDKNGQSSGNTQFLRTYTQGTTVSLTAPSVVGNSSFRRWNLDGAPWQATHTVSLPMGTDHTVTAVYVAGQTLTVNSATPNVTVTVWNTDIFGRRDGTTSFTRIYATGGTASLTVPALVGGKPFVRWEKDGVAVSGTSRTVTVTMDAAHTVNAVYAP